MSYASIATNQCISCNNLQDAVNNFLFLSVTSIPVSTKQVTKEEFETYILYQYTGIPEYPPYAVKTPNQLIVKGDINLYGDVTLIPNYGIYFTDIEEYSGLFSFPVTSTSTSQFYQSFGLSPNPWTFRVYLDGTMSSPSGNASVELLVNNVRVDGSNIPFTSGPQYVFLTMDVVYAPNDVTIRIIDDNIYPIPAELGNNPFSTGAINRGSGQYQLLGQAVATLSASAAKYGPLYRSTDYGATWEQTPSLPNYINGYWQSIAYSDDGKYALAAEIYGKLWLSSNYGDTWTNITGDIPPNLAARTMLNVAINGDGTYMLLVTGEETVYSTCGGPNTYAKNRLYLSTNSGGTWNEISMNGCSTTYPDYGYVSCDISSSGQYMQVGCAYGYHPIWYSSNYGATWSQSNTSTLQYGGAMSNMSMSSDGSTTVIAPKLPTALFYVTPSYLIKSTNYGAAYYDITGGLAPRKWNTAALYYAGGQYNAYATYLNPATGGNTNVSNVSNLDSVSIISGAGLRYWTFVVSSSDGQYVLAGTGSGVWRSSNSGNSWTQIV